MFRVRDFVCAGLVAVGVLTAEDATARPIRVAWSIYVGWMPWDWISRHGIAEKWGRKYGIDIEIVQINDYIESINQYTAGAFDAVAVTNMDTMTIPAASGVDTTILVIGDYSNGNDGIVIKGSDRLESIIGADVYFVEFSVSHYLLARALSFIGASEADIRTVTVSDADIVSIFQLPQVRAVVTWNPQLSQVLAMHDAHLVFDSSRIPGEILDLLVVRTDVLREHPEVGHALVGAWYEAMSALGRDDEAGRAMRAELAAAAGTDLAGYETQMRTTRFFFTPSEALGLFRSDDLKRTMRYVADFSFAHGLLGEGAASADAVGIAFPDGTVQGDPANVKMRFDDRFTAAAAAAER